MIATRMSISERPALTRAAPSCGKRRSAMFRLAMILMREIRACGNTPTGAVTVAQQAVDAHAYRQPRQKRLDMNVACAQLRRLFEKVIDGPHHRRATGEIAQTFDVVFAQLRRVSSPSVSAALSSSRCERTTPISSKLATWMPTLAPMTICAARCRAASVGSATARTRVAVLQAIWKRRHLAQEAVRKSRRKRLGRHHRPQRHTLQPQNSATSSANWPAERSVRSQSLRRWRNSPEFVSLSSSVSRCCDADNPRTVKTNRQPCVFQSGHKIERDAADLEGRLAMSTTARQRVVIDPKYDACTKSGEDMALKVDGGDHLFCTPR